MEWLDLRWHIVTRGIASSHWGEDPGVDQLQPLSWIRKSFSLEAMYHLACDV